MKKPSRKSIIKKLDIAVSLFIRARDKACVLCGKEEGLTNGHIFSRTNYSTRWDITKDGNCHTQCSGCNYRHEYEAWSFYRWYIKKFGENKFEALSKRHHELTHYKTHDLIEMLDKITTKL